MSADEVKYSHRNASPEIPTEEGHFFFQGNLHNETGWYDTFDEPQLVYVNPDEDTFSYPEVDKMPWPILSKSEGYWWGPFPVPQAVTA